MQKLPIKISIIILSVILIAIVVAVSTVVFLINNGKLTPYIERQIKENSDLNINIAGIHLNIFSELQLKQISVKGLSDQEQFTLECNTLTIHYKLLDLLRKHIQSIDISDAQIILDIESEKTEPSPSPHEGESIPFRIKDVYPERLFIENISLNNVNVKSETGGYLFELTELDMQVKEIQQEEPFAISIQGSFSASSLRNTHSNLIGKININTNYSLSDDKLIFLDNSHFLVNDSERFSINGTACSLLSSPDIKCNISGAPLLETFKPMIPKKYKDWSLNGTISTNTTIDYITNNQSWTVTAITNLSLSKLGFASPDYDYFAEGISGHIKIDLSTDSKFRKLSFDTNGMLEPFIAQLGVFTTDMKKRETHLSCNGNYNIQNNNLVPTTSSHENESRPFRLKDVYPERLIIENISLNNVNVKTTTGGYIFELTEMDMQVKEIQQAKPIAISTRGTFSVSNLRNTHSDLIGKININTNYSLPDDKLTILDNSYFLVNNSERFSINGTACSLLSSPDIKCNISGASLLETFKPMIPEKYKEWSLNGTISTNTTIDYITNNQSSSMTAVTNLSLSKLGFASPDYDYFAEGISGHIKIELKTDSNFRKLSFDTNGMLEPFIVQLGEFTTDMKNRKTELSFNGNYDFQNNNLNGIDSALSWDDLGTLTTRGEILNIADNPNLDINIEIEEIDNAAFFETFVKDTVEYSNPELFNTRIEGESNTHLYINGSRNKLAINGQLNVKDFSLSYGDISIKDASINLPVSMAYPYSKTLIRKQDITETQYGTVQFKNLSYGPLEIDDVRFNPLIISNNFFIKDSFIVPIFDGTIDIKNLSVKNIINSDRKIELGFQLYNISLEALTTTYKLTPFEGILSSSVMTFQQQEQKLHSDDEINIKLFGGEITISDLTLNNFLKSMTEIGFSAKVKHLNLGKMSNTYREWGNITGIINGNIEDFKIVAGEPSGFEIEMKTEKYPGIKQTVSTKFLKNFVPGIGKVLDKVGFTNYKYAVMGLHARLENDYVKLRGAVRKDGKELFMKGAGMKRLEIVFPNVDKRVPFKTFLDSFKGILGSDIDDTQVQFK